MGGREADGHSRVVGHRQAVGDALVGGQVGDVALTRHDLTDLALRHADGPSDGGLAGAGVSAHEA
jgi:hypothetical protein